MPRQRLHVRDTKTYSVTTRTITAPNDAYGSRAGIYVLNIDYATLNDTIARSVFITHAQGEDVEVGWTADSGGRTNPYLYLEYVNNGADSGFIFQTNIPQSDFGQFENIRSQDANADGVFTEYMGSTSYGQTPQMGWSKGYPATNTERHNSCDPDFGHFQNIKKCTSTTPCGWVNYGKLECLRNDTNTYDWVKVSSDEHTVSANGSGKCPTNA
jgi:hypothetical protein